MSLILTPKVRICSAVWSKLSPIEAKKEAFFAKQWAELRLRFNQMQ